MQIRQFKPTDIDAIRDICFLTAQGKAVSLNKELCCTLFADYYLHFEPSNCFVLTAENDAPVGYVLCAQDYELYHKTFMENYYSKLKSLSRYEAFLKKHERVFLKKIIAQYPAHLHIDILDSYQGKGYGKGLIRKLLDSLKSKGIKGVHLIVGATNKGAIKFYYKLGFKKVKSIFGQAIVLAKKI
ncbi:MAG: GNAT family N-acetyltransferase [Christensenellales bacterium]